ncbi:MAG: hypothetical protein BWK80_32100 [Desulfobacteraceae bacterium IS3]|nr:MAG: hypothetical protein BWK80_32100 [Desulfobacteraceae bacterium IS3]
MKKIFSFSCQSISSKLFLINILIITTFSLIIFAVFFSFHQNKNLLTDILSAELGQMMENSRSGREIGKIIADTNFIISTFYGKDEFLKAQSKNIISETAALSSKVANAGLKKSLNEFDENIRKIFKQCEKINLINEEINKIHQKTDDDAAKLGELISEKIINYSAEGQDTSILERLPYMISGYRETILRIRLLYTESGLEYFKSSEKEQENPVLSLSDDLELRVRTLNAYDSDIAEYGRIIMNDIETYKKTVISFNHACLEFLKDINLVNQKKENLLKFMKETDAFIAERGRESVRIMADAVSERIIKGSFFIVFIVLNIAGFVFFLSRSVNNSLNQLISGIQNSSQSLSLASENISSASIQLAQSTAIQADSLGQTSYSLEQINSATRQHAENADRAYDIAGQTAEGIEKANSVMSDLTKSMQEISQASQETRKIIKIIDEIAFRTNLLALNAAVEAARAGQAGAGFAVVANEVRSLAMQSAESAKNTNEIIEGIIQKIKDGSKSVITVYDTFNKVETGIKNLGGWIGEVAQGSNKQAKEISQINKSVSEMDALVKQNAVRGEELAETSQEMNTQVKMMNEFVNKLDFLVGKER